MEYKGYKLEVHTSWEDRAPEIRVKDLNGEYIGDYATMKKAKAAVDRKLVTKRAFKKFDAVFRNYGRITTGTVNSVSKDGWSFNYTHDRGPRGNDKDSVRIKNAHKTIFPASDWNLQIIKGIESFQKEINLLQEKQDDLRRNLKPFEKDVIESWHELLEHADETDY